jgi:pilus assembly protein CpaB
MRRLTPAGVSTLMVVVVGLLVTAYFAKLMRAEEPRLSLNLPSLVVEFRNVPITVAALEPGTVVTAAHLQTTQVRGDTLKPDVLQQERSVVGRTVKERIPAGAVIRSSQLYPPGERPLPGIARGMRAVSIPLKEGIPLLSGAKGSQYVDVYLTPRMDAASDARVRGGMTLTLFRGVRLLAVTQNESAGETVGSATLELTPEQATVLILARERGSIALSYNPDGKGSVGVNLKGGDRVTLDEILGRPAPAQQTTGPFKSEIYKGSARSTQQFEESASNESTSTTRTDPQAESPTWTRRRPATFGHRQPPERIAAAIAK